MEHDYLARALARAGVMPARQAEEAVRSGRVRINGRKADQPLTVVRRGDSISVDGRPVSLETRTRVLALNKPAGCITTAVDPDGRCTVFDVLRERMPPALHSFEWHAIGRLDADTTGLLLFTNDEGLVAHVTQPASKLPKRYRATVQGVPAEAALEPLRQGLRLGKQTFLPVRARVRGPSEVELILEEGRYHQAKQMLGAVGFPVRALHREAIGRLELAAGGEELRELSPEEIRDGLAYEPRTFPIGAT
jgi:pseudouridine synthase